MATAPDPQADEASAADPAERGRVLLESRRPREAEALFREALALAPGDARNHARLGAALRDQGRLGEAIAAYQAALDLDPLLADALNNLALIAKNQGRYRESLALLDRLVASAPANDRVASNRLLTMQYGSALDRGAMFAAHVAWAERHERPVAALLAPANDRDPDRRLRVGYVSPDFRFHPVAYFAGGVLAAHDRVGFEVVCYSAVKAPDAMTAILRGLGHAWRDVARTDHEALARQIRADGIDVLVDLAGHTARHRLLAFARRPAPVQFTYLGYPDTTGLDAIGHRLTDAIADPPGESDARATERLVRLQGGFLAYVPAANAPAVSGLPALQTGAVTFGSLNNLAKLSDETLSLWARVLRAVPGSRLVIKSPALGDAGTRDLLAGRLAARGIDAARLTVMPGTRDQVGHLSSYERIDVALDPTPYNGTTTTCEALWMGVPVVTLAGDRHSARVGASILTHAGLGHLVASDERGYVRNAASLAADLPALARFRAGLREAVARSPLLDPRRLARAIEAAYRQAWRDWCARAPVDRARADADHGAQP